MKILIHGMSVQTSSALILSYCGKSQFLQVVMLWCSPWGILHLQSQLSSFALFSLLKQLVFSCIVHPDELCDDYSVLPWLDQLTCCLCHLVFPLAICETLKIVHSLTTILQFALGNATTPSGGRTDDKSRKNISPGTWLILWRLNCTTFFCFALATVQTQHVSIVPSLTFRFKPLIISWVVSFPGWPNHSGHH